MINPIFILIFFKWLVQNEIDTRDYRAIEGLQMTRSLLEGCTVHYVWEPRAFINPPKKPLVYERLYV